MSIALLFVTAKNGCPLTDGWLDSSTSRLLLLSRSVMSDHLQPHGLQHTRILWPSSSPRTHSNSSLSSQWCHPTILSSVIPFPFCLQSFPASGAFPMSQLFASEGQGVGASASASVLPVNIQDGFPLGLTGLISLQSKGLSRIFSSITDTLLYIKQITNKDLLYGTGNSIQYSVMIYRGKESKSEWTYLCM